MIIRSLPIVITVLALLASSTSSAQVAVAVTLPDANVTHRDIAASVVRVVAGRWEVLEPALSRQATVLCGLDVECLRGLAAEARASHLLIVGVAGLGLRDAAVSVRLLDASGRVLFDDAAVVSGSDDPLRSATDLGERLAATPSVPPRLPRLVHQDTDPARGLLGAGLLGAGVVIGAGSWFGALALRSEPATVVGLTGIAAGVVIAAVGAGFVVADTP